MPNYDPIEEKRLAECLQIIQDHPYTKLAKLAREKRVSYDKLRRRIRHVQDGRSTGGHNKRLNQNQDEGLKRYISYLIRIGQPPTKRTITGAANNILRQTEGLDASVGSSWATRWLTRNKEWFKTIRSKTLATQRKAVYNKDDIEGHFRDF